MVIVNRGYCSRSNRLCTKIEIGTKVQWFCSVITLACTLFGFSVFEIASFSSLIQLFFMTFQNSEVVTLRRESTQFLSKRRRVLSEQTHIYESTSEETTEKLI